MDRHGSTIGGFTDGTLLRLWGGAVAGGWLVSQAAAIVGGTSEAVQLGVTAFWLVGSLVPIAGSALWMRRRSVAALFPVWTLLGVGGLVASFAVAAEAVAVSPVSAFGGLWFVGPAVGFGVTAVSMNDWSGRLYAGAAAANLAAGAAVVAVPGFESVYFAVAAVVQGLPMLYHSTRLDR
ncbi:MAG: hypothetical protein ABEJ79_05420 [Halolamina sp.]